MPDEAEFNVYAAGEFIVEYERETGQLYRSKRMGQPFPDVILEAPNGREVGVEFVSVVLPFINQERSYFDGYRRAFMAALRSQRPRYGRVRITLQPHHLYVEQGRPMRFPDISGCEGRQLVADFARLLDERFENLSTAYGGKEGGSLLDQLRNTDGTLCYPALSKYFGAILFCRTTAREVSSTDTQSDEPEIADPVVWYRKAEIPIAILRALETKTTKGRAYSAEVLVLHTLPKSGVPDASGIGMNANELTDLGRVLLAAVPELRTRFQEIWFLNQHITDSKRLYRLN